MAKKLIRKIATILLTLALVLSLSVSALAATPRLKIPSVPTVPKFNVEIGSSFWDRYFETHPIKIGS